MNAAGKFTLDYTTIFNKMGNSMPNHPGQNTTISEFFLLLIPVRYPKVRKKYPISDPGVFGNPIFSAGKKRTPRPKNVNRDMSRRDHPTLLIVIFFLKYLISGLEKCTL